jgi:pimeloyl-ACP methyl ester carboxylesterase
MGSGSRRWKWGSIAGLLIAGLLLRGPLNHLFFSARLALSMHKLASGATGQDLAVIETKIRRKMGARDCEALLYRPANAWPNSAVVLVPGISELGCYHPRLVALARFLADRGLLVITPDIQAFREFQISAEPIEQVLFWYDQIGAVEGSEEIQKAGLAGISFSGTLALMAAARPEICNRVGFIAGIGSYYSLTRCTGNWFAPQPKAAANDTYPTRWIVMLSALNMVVSPKDRIFLHDVLNNLLLQKKVPPAGPDITAEGLRWYRLATLLGGWADEELARKIEDYLVSRIYPQLDPNDALDRVRCPVFLIHGAYDDLIPPRESMQLHRHIDRSYLLISPFLTHTYPTDTALSPIQKAKAAIETLVFCYQFSRAIT